MTVKYLHKLGKQGYRIFIRALRRTIAHKKSRLGLHAFLIMVILVVGTFPYANQVFGQVEANLSSRPVATEEVIVTTKRTSRLPVSGSLSQGFSYYHPGVDIQSPMNTPIYPFLGGVVSETGYQTGGYGNYVLLDHENGYFSLYAHMSKILVAKGDRVDQNKVIGNIGVTGFSTGSHLHFEIYENGFAVNPLAVLPEVPSSPAYNLKGITGGSNTGRPLILPIAQQAFVEAQNAPKTEAKKEEKPVAVWLPNEVKTTTIEKTSEVDAKITHQLPVLPQL